MSGLVRLSDEHQLLRESVAKIASAYGHKYFADRARQGLKVDELWQALGDGGFLGVNIPEEYGGGGMGVFELSLVLEEVAAHGCPLLMIIVSPGICAPILIKHGSAEQKQAWLPDIASGRRKMAFGITEPDAGSNSHKITTTAHRDGGGWRLSGTKYYISGVDEAAAVLVVARTSTDEASGRGRLSLFIVPTDAPGFTKTPIETEIVSPEKQFTLFFDDVLLGPEALIGDEGNGLRQVFAGLNPERITAGAMASGISRYALERASRYASDRQVWGAPIGTHQGIAHPLAECYIQAELARLAVYRAAEIYDAGQDAGEAANLAKFSAADAAVRTLDQAIQTHGGHGVSREYGLADLWFLTRLTRTAPVSREMILNFVAQHSLGLPRSY